jgi:hypothetical protein
MTKLFSILGLLIFIVSCSTTAVQPQNQLAVLETWSGFAKGIGAECSDAEVEVKILEDFSIKGLALATSYNMKIPLRGKVDPNKNFHASGSGGGGISVTYKGIVSGETASGTWETNVADCQGTWKMAKNNQ